MRNRTGVLLALALLLAGYGVARAQATAREVLAPVAALAATLELRAQTLEESGAGLQWDTMQQLVREIDARLNQLADLSAPYEPLAALLPDMRATAAEMDHDAELGTGSDVADGAGTLRRQIADFRVVLRNLQAGPYLSD